jgi:catechol 2,3-dioxygenase-like lactoylglutathione lyase family enzyme
MIAVRPRQLSPDGQKGAVMQITALGHAGIGVRDLQASRAFYSGVLGMRALPSAEVRKVSFQVSESEQLTVREIGRPADLQSNGVHHIAFIVGNTPMMLDEAAQHLEAHRVGYERVAHEEHESLYCRDPDGHLIELYYWPSW